MNNTLAPIVSGGQLNFPVGSLLCKTVEAVELDPTKKVVAAYNIKAKATPRLNSYINN